ncbi:MAG TPA: ankyrin repeat domain-containing protein [bacterium]|nr:ankyrin repeat domain-containing protein [bacterium]
MSDENSSLPETETAPPEATPEGTPPSPLANRLALMALVFIFGLIIPPIAGLVILKIIMYIGLMFEQGEDGLAWVSLFYLFGVYALVIAAGASGAIIPGILLLVRDRFPRLQQIQAPLIGVLIFWISAPFLFFGMEPELERYFKQHATLVKNIQMDDRETIGKMLREKPGLVNQKDEETGDTPLMAAVGKGDVSLLRKLLDSGADPNIKGPCRTYGHGCTPLHNSADQGKREICELLLDHGVDINARSGSGQTALSMGNPFVMETLLLRGADPNIPDDQGTAPLHKAVRSGNLEMARLLLENGADPNLKTAEWDGASPLLLAADLPASEDMIALLLASGADPNCREDRGKTPLHHAAQRSNQAAIDLLLQAGADPDLADRAGRNFLFELLKSGDPDVFKAVLPRAVTRGAGLDGTDDYDKMTLLHVAAKAKRADAVKLLLKQGADPSVTDKTGRNFLFYLLDSADPDTFRLALAKAISRGVDINEKVGDSGETLLHLAAKSGRPEIVKVLLQKGSDANAIDARNQQTALHYAAESGNEEIVKLLLAFKADPNARDERRLTPLFRALDRGQTNAALALIAGKADPQLIIWKNRNFANWRCDRESCKETQKEVMRLHPEIKPPPPEPYKNYDCPPCGAVGDHDFPTLKKFVAQNPDSANKQSTDGSTPLLFAVMQGDTPMVEFLIAHGAEVNHQNQSHNFPLLVATRKNDLAMMEILLKNGADTGALNEWGFTPLHFTAYKEDQAEAAELLLKHGAKVDASNKKCNGWTPLLNAAREGAVKTAAVLLQHGADREARTTNGGGRTPLALAAQYGQKDFVALMIEKGADMNARDSLGRSPLHLCVTNSFKAPPEEIAEVVRLLAARGADLNARDKEGKTPLHLAVINNHKDMVELLCSLGADRSIADQVRKTPLDYAKSMELDEIKAVLKKK